MRLNQAMDLAAYTSIDKWKPKVGDVIVFTGFITRWIGIISNEFNGEVEIIKHGLPCELVTMGPQEQKKNTLKLDVSEIVRSARGKYAVLSIGATGGQQIWYIN